MSISVFLVESRVPSAASIVIVDVVLSQTYDNDNAALQCESNAYDSPTLAIGAQSGDDLALTFVPSTGKFRLASARLRPKVLFRSFSKSRSSFTSVKNVYVTPMPSTGRQCASGRSEEHTSELQSLMRISYAVFCLKKKTNQC